MAAPFLRVFLSWSGSRSYRLAGILKIELPRIVPGLEAWMSSEDVEPGAFWTTALAQQFEGFRAAVLCLTPENTRAPWILFEAGALMASADSSRVIPYTWQFEPHEVSFPLSLFQGCAVDRAGTERMVAGLRSLAGAPGAPDTAFDSWWEALAPQLASIPATAPTTDVLRSLRSGDFAQPTLFASFFGAESGRLTQRLEQLTEGTVAIFSSEVERLELDLFNYMRAGGLTRIVAVDLTTNPGVLLTRNRRRAERRRFIGDGGRIQRLFVVSREAMLRPDFAHDARELLQQEATDGVDVGLVFLEQLRGQQAQDYILYDAFAAVVESVQADRVYSLGVSTIHFRKRDVELFSSLFAEVWPAGPSPAVVRAAQAFMAVPLERLKTATGRRNVQALLDDIYAARD